jgi:predicted transglutaminase-like cysteine proteinase
MLFRGWEGIGSRHPAGNEHLLSVSAKAGDAFMPASATPRSPIGWVEFCADNPGDCRGGATQPRDIVMSQTAWRDLLGHCNSQRDHQADDRHRSLGRDREMVAANGRATRLQDYVLLKRKMLIDAGGRA